MFNRMGWLLVATLLSSGTLSAGPLSEQKILEIEHNRLANAVRVEVTVPQLRKQLMAEFHPYLLAQTPNSLILRLNEGQMLALAARGYVVRPATEWRAKHFQWLKKQLQEHKKPDWCYPTVEEMQEEAERIANTWPERVKRIDIGDSWETVNGMAARDILVLRLGPKHGEAEAKMLVTAGVHAREMTPPLLVLDWIRQLLRADGIDPEVSYFLDNRELHVVLMVNPDGRKYAEQNILWRKNTNTEYCSQSPDLRGADLNRNFSFNWGNGLAGSNSVVGASSDPCDETYLGKAPASEPEVMAVEAYARRLFADERPDDFTTPAPTTKPGVFVDIHSFSELVLYPWGHDNTVLPNPGLAALAERAAQLNGYYPMSAANLYPTTGTTEDLGYGELGVASVTFEIGTQFFESCSDYEAKVRDRNLKALNYLWRVADEPYLSGNRPLITESTQTWESDVVKVRVVAERCQNTGCQPSAVVAAEYAWDAPVTDATAAPMTVVNVPNASGAVFEVQFDRNALGALPRTLFLRAKNQEGRWSPPYALTIHSQNLPPVARATIACDGLSCTLDGGESNDMDGQVIDWQWFVDGVNIGQGQNITFDTVAGEHTLKLVVTDNDNHTSQHVRTFTVGISEQKPTVSATADCTGLTCTLEWSAADDGTVDSVEVDWGDGEMTTSPMQSESHTYQNDANYQIRITATDDVGQTASKVVYVALKAQATSEPENNDGGGGGAAWWWLMILGGAQAMYKRQRNA